MDNIIIIRLIIGTNSTLEKTKHKEIIIQSEFKVKQLVS